MAYPSPRRLQLRRGNASAISSYLGYAGELVVDTSNWTLYVHDGVTVGGYAATVNTAAITGNISSILNGTAVFGNIIPSANTVYSLGNITHQWKSLFVSNSTIYVGGVPLSIDTTGNLTVNGNVIPTIGYVNTVVANVTVDLSSYALNANVTAANVGLKGYVDQANTIQSAQVGAANLAIIAANVGMRGYVDSQSFYSNTKVATYLPTYSGNIANVRLGASGQLTFADGAYIKDGQFYAAIGSSAQLIGGNDYNQIRVDNNLVEIYTSPDGFTQYNWQFGNTGTLTFPDNSVQSTAYSNIAVSTYLASHTNQTIGGNLTIQGNLTVNGNVTYISVNNLVIGDNIINLADLNPADSLDLGFAAHRTPFGQPLQHTGLVRDASANQWRLFSNVVPAPGTTVDFTNAVYDDLQLGNVTSTGNITATYFIGDTQGLVGSITNLTSLNLTVENIGALISSNGVNIGAGGYNNLLVLPTDVLIQNVPLTVAGNIIANESTGLYITANLPIGGTAQIWNFGADGRFSFPGTPLIDTGSNNFEVQGAEAISLEANAAVNIYTDTSGSTNQWQFRNDGNIQFPDASQQRTAWTGTVAYSQVTGAYSNVNVGIFANLSTYAYSANVTAANVGIIGYIDQANTTMRAYVDGQIAAANTNVSGGGTNYGNGNVASYLITNGYVNSNSAYGNGNVTAYTVTQGFTNYSNVNVAAYTTTQGYTNYSNVNVAAYLPSHTGNVGVSYLLGTTPNIILTAGSYSSTFDTLGNVVLPSAYVTGNVTAQYFVGNGSQLVGLPAGYSNIQLAAYLNATGYNLYSNANVASYLPLYGGDVSARNITVSGNINLTGNILQINSAIFYGNTITGFSALYAGIPGYTPIPQVVAQFTTDFNGYAQINSQNLGTGDQATSDFIATANNGTDSAYFVDFGIAGSGYDPAVAANNNAIGTALTPNDAYLYTAGNTAANPGGNLVIGVQTLNKNIRFFAGGVNANNVVLTIQGNGITTSGNTTAVYFIGNGSQLTGLPATYGNIQTKAYAETMGYQNYGNVNVKAYTEAMGFANYSNVNVQAYTETMGFKNYSNVNVAAYLATATINTTGNITAAYISGNISVIGNVTGTSPNVTIQAGSYSSTFDNQGNVTVPQLFATGNIQTSGYLFGNGALLTGIVASGGGGTNYSNVNVQAYTETMGFKNYSNVNVAAYLNATGYNLYSNVNVASYLGVTQILVANIKLNPSGNIVFADGTIQTTAATGSYSNIQVATYLPTYTGSVNASNILVTGANITLANIQATTAATNTATGALRVMGGVGVAGTVVAGHLNSAGNVLANAISAYSLNTVANVTASVVNAGTVNSAGNVLAQNIIGTIATASQTAITAVGTLATLSVTGNATVGNLVGTEANTRIIANAYVTTFDIYGNVTFPGAVSVSGIGITMPARPAFRVNGTSLYAGAQSTANVNLKGVAVSTVYNQGSYFDETTGKFTAPVAGIYEVLLNSRVNSSYNGLQQLVVLKNGLNTAGNVIAFWESGGNTSTAAAHWGVSGTVILAVGDYLSANILAGNVTFDTNDNWCVTYLG